MPAIDHVILNENAYFLKKETGDFLSNNHITEIFRTASESRKGNYSLKKVNEVADKNGNELRYSICVFKFEKQPSFIDEPITGWVEQKLAYLLIIDFNDYVLISKKNISGVDDLLYQDLDSIDYTTLSSLFVDDTTSFEKFAMNNTSVSADSLRGKTVEANDLKKSFPTFGAGRYVLSSLRVNNNDVKTTIVFNTSRITKFGDKKDINDLIDWAWDIAEKLRNHVPANSFLSVFAEPIEYEAHKDTLKPISVLFNTIKLHEDIEKNIITSCELKLEDGRTRPIALQKLLVFFKNVFSVEEDYSTGDSVFYIESKIVKGVEVSLNRKSITLSSRKASKINLHFADGDEQSLISYFNHYNDFIINFEEVSFVYTNRKLFRDNKLIGYIDSFIDVFKGKNELTTVTSEKGDFTAASTTFSNSSIFNFVENSLINNADYSFLDDLGDEWGDFIKLKNNSISLIHAKHDTSQLSASSFHEVVGQALKNIGNFNPSADRLDGSKQTQWNRNYVSSEGINTAIPRLRKGDTVANGITAYKRILLNPNIEKEVVLAINFISRANLKDKLERLKAGEVFGERKQVIQILWIISSLISSCVENGIGIHIYCKP